MSHEALNKAISIAGGQTALARLLGDPITQAHVWNWMNRDKKLPAEIAIKIELATNSKVTRRDLRPDIFGSMIDDTS